MRLPQKSVEEAALNLGVDNNIGVGGLGEAEMEGTGLLGMDCLLIPKGQVGTVGINDVGTRLVSRGWFSS